MSIIESASTVGARLSAAREDLGLSIEDVSARTCIRPNVITGIENDDFAPCGGPFYARGHIRTLARTLHIDEAPLIEQFDQLHGAPENKLGIETKPVEPLPLRPKRQPRSARPKTTSSSSSSSGPGWFAVAVTAVVVFCIVALVGFLLSGGSGSKDKKSTAKPKASAAPRKAPAPAPPARVFTQGATLELTMARGASWVQVTDESGKVLVSSTQPMGTHVEYNGAQNLHLVLGNAGAVDGSCNGHPLGPLGNVGQVVVRQLAAGTDVCPLASAAALPPG